MTKNNKPISKGRSPNQREYVGYYATVYEKCLIPAFRFGIALLAVVIFIVAY